MTNHGGDASAEQMRKLEALFGGSPKSGSSNGALSGPMPSSMTQSSPRAFASPRRQEGRELSKYTIRRRTLESARDPDAVRKAATEFLEHHALPDDMDILLKLLQHESEKVLCDVMGLISLQLHRRRARATIILVDRLKEIGSRNISEATQSCLDGLHQQIKALESA